LLRWQHPEQGLISPYKFAATAENTGLLRAAGQWLILEACKQLQSWSNKIPGIESVNISANISAKQLADAHFVPEVERILRETGIDPSQLCLELTEDVAASDPRLTASVLSNLRQMRVGVILDDFGTGNSSLVGLRQLPVEGLKIDRSLIGGMLLDRGARDTVEIILLLAHKLRLKAIAEGIESAKQLDHLNALGCEMGQGYIFSPPVEAKAAQELLRQRNSSLFAKVAKTAE
jgi:EAL domain-containing protein (putative c-di-GMP-specific phosphodiesterase class I)